MDVLLTNDDGIDAVGLRALYDAIEPDHDVTVVAPRVDQSAVGRQLSHRVDLTDHELGYAVDGTPADCVVATVGALGLDPDLVVAGCNAGANLGEYVLGRSGTVSAAVEAAFFGLPAIAASVYFPVDDVDFASLTPDPADFDEAARAVRYLLAHVDDDAGPGVFEHADYLNVNAPRPTPDGPARMEVTRPSHVYEMDAIREGATVHINDRIWDRMAEGDVRDPEGTDRRAIVEGRISVSPLTAPHSSTDRGTLEELAAAYRG